MEEVMKENQIEDIWNSPYIEDKIIQLLEEKKS